MMGDTHAMTGTLAFGGASLAVAFNLVGPVDLSVFGWIMFGVLTTAAALFPDIDHRKATVTKSFGGLTKIVRWLLIKPFFGKHREGTHSIFFAGLVGFGAWLLVRHIDLLGCKIGLLALLSIATSSLIRLFHIRGWLDDVMPIPVWGFLIFFTDTDFRIVPWALALGCLTHVVGDCLTEQGCPILWPISKQRITLSLYSTGKTGEGVVKVITLVGCLFVITLHLAHLTGLV